MRSYIEAGGLQWCRAPFRWFTKSHAGTVAFVNSGPLHNCICDAVQPATVHPRWCGVNSANIQRTRITSIERHARVEALQITRERFSVIPFGDFGQVILFSLQIPVYLKIMSGGVNAVHCRKLWCRNWISLVLRLSSYLLHTEFVIKRTHHARPGISLLHRHHATLFSKFTEPKGDSYFKNHLAKSIHWVT